MVLARLQIQSVLDIAGTSGNRDHRPKEKINDNRMTNYLLVTKFTKVSLSRRIESSLVSSFTKNTLVNTTVDLPLVRAQLIPMRIGEPTLFATYFATIAGLWLWSSSTSIDKIYLVHYSSCLNR